MQNTHPVVDGLVCRALFIKPSPVTDDVEGEASKGLIGYSLLISAVRCTLQYVVLPFILPLIGLAVGWAQGITMIISAAAVVAIITSIRRMWQTNYTHRYRYLAIAVPAFIVLVTFLVMDVMAFLQ